NHILQGPQHHHRNLIHTLLKMQKEPAYRQQKNPCSALIKVIKHKTEKKKCDLVEMRRVANSQKMQALLLPPVVLAKLLNQDLSHQHVYEYVEYLVQLAT